MVIYDIQCASDHRFEGWFSTLEDFNGQLEGGLVSCPVCGSLEVRKVPTAAKIGRDSSMRAQREKKRSRDTLEQHLAEHFIDVGENFPEEARKIYYGEAENRNVYGTARASDIVELHEEGIPVVPLQPTGRSKLDS